MRDADPGQDQEASVIDDQWQVALARGGGPADEVVAAVPVGGQAAYDLGQQVRGEMRDADPGQDQEASVIDDQWQVALARGGGPADEAVAGGGFPGGGAEAEQGQRQAVAGVHEVAQLGAGQVLVAEIVVAVQPEKRC